MPKTYQTRLTADDYELFLTSAPVLAEKFLSSRWTSGMTAAAAAKLLADHGYRSPADVRDSLSGRALGHQSTLRNQGFLRW